MEKSYFGKICLIEDNPMDVLLIKEVVRLANFADDIVAFQDPEEALYYFKGIRHPFEVPEMIFLDLNMPKFNGFELIDKMESEVSYKIYKRCQFTIVTSSSDPNDIMRSTAYKNVLAYLTKPVEIEDLKKENFLVLKEHYFRQKNMMWG